MKINYLRLLLLIPVLFIFSCSDDDEDPTVKELIMANPWRVDNYDVQASSGGITIPQSILDPFLQDVIDEAPLNGTITFNESDFSISDNGTTITGTWSLSADEKMLTMVFAVGNQSFTFDITEITSSTFKLTLSTTENIPFGGNTVPVTLEVIATLLPA